MQVMIALLMILSFCCQGCYQFGIDRQKAKLNFGKREIDNVGIQGYESADVHYVTTGVFKVFNLDRLEVDMSANFSYIIRKDEQLDLLNTYGSDYDLVIKSSAIDSIKGDMTHVSMRDMYSRAAIVEDSAFKAVRERLGGRCCNSYCNRDNPLCSACKTVCEPYDKGLHVEVIYFKLDITIPAFIKQRLREILEQA